MISLDEVRPLSSATDSIDVSGSEVSLDSATLAALENVVVSGEVALDSATLAALENVIVSATDLDIRDLAFATDSVDVSGSEVSLDAATLAALESVTVVESAFSSWKSTAQSITSTAAQLAATSLTGRKMMTIQNLGNADIFIGASNAVTISNGTKIAKFSSFSEKFSATATVWAITASGTADVRISEFAE